MIEEILKGIDKTETESEDGWWETSAGAEFGAKKLQEVLDYIQRLDDGWYAHMNRIDDE